MLSVQSYYYVYYYVDLLQCVTVPISVFGQVVNTLIILINILNLNFDEIKLFSGIITIFYYIFDLGKI